MVLRGLAKQVGTLAFGSPFGGLITSFAYDTLKALRLSKGSGQSGRGGYDAVEQDRSSGSTIPLMRKYQQIPAVAGTHRITPAPATAPWTTLAGGNEILTHQVFKLQGPHGIAEPYVNDTLVSSFDDNVVTLITRPGADDDTPIAELTQTVFEEILQEPLTRFRIAANSTRNLADQANPGDALKRHVVHASKGNAREIIVRLALPAGLIRQGSTINSTAIRWRLRPKGSTAWRNGPEMRLIGNYTEHRWLEIRFKFEAAPGGLTRANWNNFSFPAAIFNKVYTPSANAFSADYTADPYFGPAEGSGTNVFSNTNAHNTLHYDAGDSVATFYLDPDDPDHPWPIDPNGYEIDLLRGYGGSAMWTQNFGYFFDIEATTGSWAIGDLGSRTLPESSDLIWHSLLTVRDGYPAPAPGRNYALMYLTARNLQVNSFSVLASGHAPIWNGTDWDTIAPTSNPAAWARDAYTNKFLAYPVADELLGSGKFEAWYDHCEQGGLTVDMVLEGGLTVEQAFAIFCEAGHAKPQHGATREVWIDENRSGDEISGILTEVNSDALRITRPDREVPQALLLQWNDSTAGYRQAEEIVRYRAGFDEATPALKRQSIVAPGKVTQDDVEAAGDRMLAERAGRTFTYQVVQGWESLKYRTGDVVGLAFDTLNEKHGAALVETVLTERFWKLVKAWGPTNAWRWQGDVLGLTLDRTLPLSRANPGAWKPTKAWQIAKLWNTDVDLAVGIQLMDGRVLRAEINETFNTGIITFKDPIPFDADLQRGCVVWSYPVAEPERRLIIANIQRRRDLSAVLTLFDEAPEIHS